MVSFCKANTKSSSLPFYHKLGFSPSQIFKKISLQDDRKGDGVIFIGDKDSPLK